MTKKLFILISDGGDGSCYAQYTMNEEWIAKAEELDREGKIEYGFPGVDGDGFHYDTLNVPVECTLKSLGIYSDLADSKHEDF